MISSDHRFHGHGSLKYIFSKGATFRSRHLILRAIRNPRRKKSRVAIIVSKKVEKRAVGRNRIRRRLFGVIQSYLPTLNDTYDIAFIVTGSELKEMDYLELQDSVQHLLTQAGVFGITE